MTFEKGTSPQPHVVEIGFGDGKKIGKLASANPDTFYIGLEVPSRQTGNVDSILSNLSLNYTGGFEGLKELPSDSISTIIMDLVLDGDFTVTQWQISFPMASKNEVRYSDLNNRIQSSTEYIFDHWRYLCLMEAKRTLRDDGELQIHTFMNDLNFVNKL